MLRILLLAALLSAIPATPAVALARQESWVEDDPSLQTDPAGTLTQLRMLGVDRVRVAVRWQQIAPNPSSHRKPHNFNAANPVSYPLGAWSVWDQIVSDANERASPSTLTSWVAPRCGRPGLVSPTTASPIRTGSPP